MSTNFDDLLNEATEEVTTTVYDTELENIEITTINAETVTGKSGTGNK